MGNSKTETNFREHFPLHPPKFFRMKIFLEVPDLSLKCKKKKGKITRSYLARFNICPSKPYLSKALSSCFLRNTSPRILHVFLFPTKLIPYYMHFI